MKDLVSKKTRLEVREYFVGTSLAVISRTFGSADLSPDLAYHPTEGGQRRTLVEQYYHVVDWSHWSDVRKFLSVVETVVFELKQLADTKSTNTEYASKALERLTHYLARDGFRIVDGRVLLPPTSIHVANAMAGLLPVDAPELHRQLERIRDAVEDDPPLAVGTAKELIESACKTVLVDHGVDVPSDWDLGRLVKEARAVLRLVPEDVPDAARGADIVRRVLANLGAVAQGIGELRNLYGTGHGRRARAKGLTPRHARLAVGAATTLAAFLLETHWERMGASKSSLRPHHAPNRPTM